MSDQNRYDPEDLELLLQSKTFSELLPEEKAFVLQHVENDAEYDSIRETLLNLELLSELDLAIAPKPETKHNLMQAFEAAHAPKALPEDKEPSKLTAWWVWFWDTNKSIFQRPAFQLASLALLVTSITFITTFNVDNQVAQLKETPKKESIKESKEIQKSVKKEKSTAAPRVQETGDSNKELKIPEEQLDNETSIVTEDESLDDFADKEYIAQNEDLFKDTEKSLELEEEVSMNLNDSEIPELAEDLTNETAAESLTFTDGSNNVAVMPTTTVTPEVVYIEESADFTALDLERTSTGNAMLFDKGKYYLDTDELAEAEEDNSPPLMASNFSSLLGKLHTSE
ncbi:MAG: hypothetical protein AB8B53_06190 [Flavobacteriales bacterium]